MSVGICASLLRLFTAEATRRRPFHFVTFVTFVAFCKNSLASVSRAACVLLLIAQRFCRIDARGAARGKKTGQQRHQQQCDADGHQH